MSTTTTAPRGSARLHVQKFGTFLSNMVMPNIGAFIAWGLITALFIEVGWLTGIFDAWDGPDSWEGKIRPGFEMLVNNFSAGIWGALLATFGFFVMSPVVTWVSDRLGSGVDAL